MEQYLIGIDDTDNKESRGTGFLSRQLAHMIHENELGSVSSITRHQLFVHDDIPYTSHNSSACLTVHSNSIESLKFKIETFLLEHAAQGSDVGLAIAEIGNVDDDMIEWGLDAKKKVLTQKTAYQLSRKKDIFLKGLTGTHDGIIGALAAVGLRKSGNDGRCIWLRGKELRELEGVYVLKELIEIINVDRVEDVSGNLIDMNEKIFTGNWLRPVIRKHKITIIAEQSKNTFEYGWKVANKDYIKSISD